MSENYIDKVTYPRTRLRSQIRVNDEIETLLASLRARVDRGLHLGAGAKKLPGLINCDLFNSEADLELDATNLWSIDDCTIDWIESHHMIEHLSFDETERALTEWHRVLRTGGLLVLTCPDVLRISINWLKYSLLSMVFPQAERFEYLVKMLVGSQEHEGMFHKNAFDSRRIIRILARHKFVAEFTYTPYPLRRTPSLLIIARKV